MQRVYENRICTSLPSSLRIAWNGVLKPRMVVTTKWGAGPVKSRATTIALPEAPSAAMALRVSHPRLLGGDNFIFAGDAPFTIFGLQTAHNPLKYLALFLPQFAK